MVNTRTRELRHDIRHELGTIIMLASAVSVAEDVGPESRARVEQIIDETRWLSHLLRRLDDGERTPDPLLLRVDELTREVVSGMRLSTAKRLGYSSNPVWAYIDPLALWRAVRNVMDNACRAAERHVDVHVSHEGGWTVIQVDDDGPGFGSGPDGLGSLGLGIVHDIVAGYGGSLEIRRCEPGGASVRIMLPSAEAERRHENSAL